jgi:hypothetical protein
MTMIAGDNAVISSKRDRKLARATFYTSLAQDLRDASLAACNTSLHLGAYAKINLECVADRDPSTNRILRVHLIDHNGTVASPSSPVGPSVPAATPVTVPTQATTPQTNAVSAQRNVASPSSDSTQLPAVQPSSPPVSGSEKAIPSGASSNLKKCGHIIGCD